MTCKDHDYFYCLPEDDEQDVYDEEYEKYIEQQMRES